MNGSMRAALAVAVAATLGTTSSAAVVWKTLPAGEFGQIWNTSDNLPPRTTPDDNRRGWCAPTALANSFQFLKSHYPAIYGNNTIIQGSTFNTRNMLVARWGTQPDQTLCPGPNGGEQRMWEVKNQWLSDFAPGTTHTSGMIDPFQDISGWGYNWSLSNVYPDFEFLGREICDEEDVELVLRDLSDPTWAHAITLTRVCWDDRNGDGMFNRIGDPGQWDRPLEIGYIDPNNPINILTGTISYGSDELSREFLILNYTDGTTTRHVGIRSAMSESPAPGTFVVLGLGGLLAARRRRSSPGQFEDAGESVPAAHAPPKRTTPQTLWLTACDGKWRRRDSNS